MRTSIALAVLALGLLVVPGAFGTRSYSDPAGDSGAAPDITSIAVSHDDAGFVSLAVTTNQPTLSPDAFFWGYIDADRQAATGMPINGLGIDEMFIGDGTGALLAHIDGSSLQFAFELHAHHVVRERRVHGEVQPQRARRYGPVRLRHRIGARGCERRHDWIGRCAGRPRRATSTRSSRCR